MASVIADMVEWLKRWFYTEDEVDTLLSSKQAILVSGSNIKTLNNESLLGSGNIEIESGDSGGLVNVEGYYFDEESENLVLDADDEPFITTSWGDPTSDSLTPSEKLVKNSLDAKQDTLVSGTNLKTINNESLLGSGNITIQGGSNVDVVTSWETTLSDSKVPSEKLTKDSLDGKLDNALSSTAVTIASNDNVLITDYSDSNNVKRVSSILASQVKDSTAHANIGSSASDTQASINSSIDTALSNKVSTSDSRLADARNPKITNLTTNDNVDEILTTGHYVLNDNVSIGGTMPSGTELTDKAFVLMVDGDNRTIRQTLTFYKAINRTFTRMYSGWNANLGWSDWKELSVVGHTHDDRYYTESEVDTALSNKVSKSSTSGLLKNDGSVDTNTYLTQHQDISGKEDKSNKVISWSSTVTDTHYPSEKLVSDSLNAKFPMPINLVQGDDIDSLLNNGFYVLNDNDISIQGTLPSVGNKAFTLLVDGDNRTKRQLLTYYKNYNRTFIRMYSGYTSNIGWSDWKELSVVGHTHDDRYYTETEMDTALTGKQDTLVSGTSIKTINNESLLGSGNITIQGGGGGSVIGTGSFSIDNNGHLIVELPNAVDNPYFINNNGHLIYDTSNTYNGD